MLPTTGNEELTAVMFEKLSLYDIETDQTLKTDHSAKRRRTNERWYNTLPSCRSEREFTIVTTH